MGAGDEVSFAPVKHHIETCLSCQASLARQRRVRRSLEDLSSVRQAAPIRGVVFGVESEARQKKPIIAGAIGAALVVGLGLIGLRRAVTH
ncbi:MAG TPA: hypothetical protein VIW46_14580 [Acidimicrobiia bacterium]|jgi:hypothetical protein